MNYLASDWCGLAWSPWVPFDVRAETFRALPEGPGLYRVRPTGGNFLLYIGQTGVGVRQRVAMLVRNTLKAEMPWNDPHTAAPSLWTYRHAENMTFECSGTACALPEVERLALECYLLWRYRLERGESTLCNHGRFHPRYTKSSARSGGRRGRLLADGGVNPASGPSWPPLREYGRPTDAKWMGLVWTAPQILTPPALNAVMNTPGVYRLLTPAGEDVIYIGETHWLRGRLRTHAASWGAALHPWFSFVVLPNAIPTYQLHEIENDLLGAYYSTMKRAPALQFGERGRPDTPA